jgi:ATP-dependent Clp protease ATP-binding subunit ClpA
MKRKARESSRSPRDSENQSQSRKPVFGATVHSSKTAAAAASLSYDNEHWQLATAASTYTYRFCQQAAHRYRTMTDIANPAAATAGVTDKEIVKKMPSTGLAYQAPFVEKYRPRTLEDVVGNEETLLRLRAIAVDGNVPNLILCGPPGTGKTSSVHALARQLLGSSYKDAVLELNASDARGIDVRSIALYPPADCSATFRSL